MGKDFNKELRFVFVIIVLVFLAYSSTFWNVSLSCPLLSLSHMKLSASSRVHNSTCPFSNFSSIYFLSALLLLFSGFCTQGCHTSWRYKIHSDYRFPQATRIALLEYRKLIVWCSHALEIWGHRMSFLLFLQ